MSRKFGLIGRSLGHSFSKDFFTQFFEINGIDASYENIEIDTIEDVKLILESNYSGLNVTVPYKESILSYLDELSMEASEIGAVNVIKIENGRTIGHNSDAYGFHQSVKPFLMNVHERALLLGTGGASKAVEYVLKQLGLDVIQISRNPSGTKQFRYDEVNEHMLKACKLVVQCTPIGMYPNVTDCISFPFQFLSTEHLVVDLIYNPEATLFLQNAKKNGATVLNGSSMLKEQALRGWELWNN